MQDFFFGRKHAWMGLILIGLGFFLCYDSIRLTVDARALDRSEARAEATITRRFMVEEPCTKTGADTNFNSACRTEVLHGAFTYQAEGQSYDDEIRIGHRRPELVDADLFTLTYLPRDPGVWQLETGEYARKGSSSLIVGLAFTLAGLLVFWAKGGFDYFRRRTDQA